MENKEKSWVLKSLGDNGGETIVPKSDNHEINKQQIINILEKDGERYAKNGFILEEKIIDGIELTPEMVWWNGEPVYSVVDIETKTMGAGEKGINVGCGTNLIVRTDLDDKINKMAFPPYVHELAKKQKGMFIMDAALLFDKKGDAYFLEYCANRLGWDSFPTEVAMSGDRDGELIATLFFENLVKGKNPLKARFGAGVRLFNQNEDSDRHPEPGLSITVTDAAEPDWYYYDVKKEDGKLVTSGFQVDLGVATGVSDNLREAIDRCYEYAEGVGFKDVLYRPKDDFLSVSYTQSILNRLKYAVEKGLIKDEGILASIQEIVDSRLANAQKELEAKMKSDYDSKLKEESGKIKDKYDSEIKKVKKAIKDTIHGE